MRPLPGVRITIVSREVHTPYSGMLPGHIAGYYGYDDAHIDLGPLAHAANARLIAAEAIGLDREQRTVQFATHPELRYDILSLNFGAAPGFAGIDAGVSTIPVKPIGGFLPHWYALRDAVATGAGSAAPVRIVVVGGGAGGRFGSRLRV